MSQYDRGRRFEWKTRTKLRKDGYVVWRAAGSKGLDLNARKPGQQLDVSCKLTGIITAAEWDELYEQALWVGAIPVLAVNGPRGRGVEFWALTGRRVRGKPLSGQPAVRFLTDEVAAAGVRSEWVEAP